MKTLIFWKGNYEEREVTITKNLWERAWWMARRERVSSDYQGCNRGLNIWNFPGLIKLVNQARFQLALRDY